MTTYRLPAEMGSAEVDVLNDDLGSNRWDVRLVDGPKDQWMTVPASMLTKAEPPLPPEPPLLGVVLDKDRIAWQREAGSGSDAWILGNAMLSWADLNRLNGPLTALVPDPATDASELPREFTEDDEDTVYVAVKDGRVQVDTYPSGPHLTPKGARNVAAAIWRAAREADDVR